jgi:hypothetical protein
MKAENTFEGGMHIDNDMSAQPKGTYRFSKNGYVFSIGEKNYVWSPAIGNQQVTGYIEDFIPIGMFSAREKVMVFSVKNDNLLGAIGWLEPVSGGYTYSHIYVYDNAVLGFSEDNIITGYSYFENNEAERIYWTDTNTKPKTLNIAVIDLTFSLTIGNKYLVLDGVLTHNSVQYTAGETFILWTYAGLIWTTDTQIVEYFEPEILDWNPDFIYEKIINIQIVEGGLETGAYSMTYRFITEFDNVTPWAPLSSPITIMTQEGSEEDPDANPSIKTWNLLKGSNNKSTESGIKVYLNDIVYDKYKSVEFAAFKSTDSVIETGVIFSRIELDKARTVETPQSTIQYQNISAIMTHYTGEFLTVAEYAVQSITLLKINDLDTVKDMQVIAGTTEEGDLGIGESMDNTYIDEPVKTCVYEMPADVLNHTEYDSDKPLAGIYSYDENGYISSGQVLSGQYYRVASFPLTYDSVPYIVDDILFGTTSRTFISEPGFPGKLKPVLRICKYLDLSGNPVFEYIDMDDAAAPKGSMSMATAGYWGGETYRLGILPISHTGKFLPVRFIEDYQVPERGGIDPVSVVQFDKDNNIVDANNSLVNGPITRSGAIDSESYQYNVKIDSLLVTVDLTDIIDDISGFCIVRAVRDKGVMSEGVIDPVQKLEHDVTPEEDSSEFDYESNYYRCPHFNIRNIQLYSQNPDPWNNVWQYVWEETMRRKYYYTNPDVVQDGISFETGDEMQLVRKYIGFSNRNNNYIEIDNEDYDEAKKIYFLRCFKAYQELAVDSEEGNPINVISGTSIDVGEQNFESTETETFYNYAVGSLAQNNRRRLRRNDPACKSILVELDYDRVWYSDQLDDDDNPVPDIVFVTQHRRGVSSYIKNNLGVTDYISTGHYQKVDADFKASILLGDRYIAQNIQVFGGDAFVNLYGFSRVLISGTWTQWISGREEGYGDYVIVPIQSRINTSTGYGRNGQLDNIGPLSGNHICSAKLKESGHYFTDVPNYYDIDYKYLENLKYQVHSYIDENQIKFPGLSLFNSNIKVFLNRTRYSNKKQTGYFIDEFLDFPALNYFDIPGDNGSITNIRGKASRLFVWQESSIGYIPINEKALASAGAGETIELGIGGIFERYDIINETYGNQDRLSLIETDAKWFWFDYYRKSLLTMNFNGQWKPESILKGMDSYFQNTLADRANLLIRSGYDPKAKVVLFSFIDSVGSATKTISINTKNGKFNGEHVFDADLYSNTLNDMFSVKKNYELIYLHNQDTGSIYGKSYQCQLSFVVTAENDEIKKFMSAIFRGGRTFFDTIKYETQYDFDSGVFLNTIEESVNTTDYEFVIDEWRAGIPEGDYGRMDGRYMLVTLTVGSTNNKLRLRKMITEYLKQH